MPQRHKKESVDLSNAIELADLATGVTDAVLGAKVRLDEHAAAIADQYKASPLLKMLAPPAFTIGEVRVVLKFAIAEIERPSSGQRGRKGSPSQVRVHVATASLSEISPHLISEIELRISPEMRRAQPTESDGERSQ